MSEDDAPLRRFGGAPTYALTDNEKTVTSTHVASIPVRNPEIVRVGRYYSTAFATCVPADPESKGGSGATVRLAKADLVPTWANLLPAYDSFEELERACAAFCEEVNGRPHRETRRAPVEMLAEERAYLHPVPEVPFTAAFGEIRSVGSTSTISFGGVRYSVPHRLVGERVWVRRHGDEVVIVSVDPAAGPVEVARNLLSTPGRPRIAEEHYPPRPAGQLGRTPRARTAEEAAFLALGEGAATWPIEAAAAGAPRLRQKMAEALSLAKLHGAQAVEQALGAAATYGRFGDGDLAGILGHLSDGASGEPQRASEDHSLQHGTGPGDGSDERHLPRSAPRGAHPPVPPAEDAARSPRGPRGPPHRQGPAAGPRRGAEGPAGEEVAGRDRSGAGARPKAAGFPSGKTFEAWDEQASSVPAPTQRALRTLERVGRRENLAVCGPSGTGETHLSEALGHLAVERGMRVAWSSLEALGGLVRPHRVDDSVGRAMVRILRAHLIVVDDVGMLPVGPDAAEGFYRPVDAAYERRSVAVGSNLHPAGWDEMMPKTLATATVDRLLHHVHVLMTAGESFRLAEATSGKGVVPLA